MNIVESDRELMERAIRVARRSVSEPDKISPKVGAVIAHGNSLVADAHRGEYSPGEHAEYTLLERKLGEDTLAGATLFTTLEPCTQRFSRESLLRSTSTSLGRCIRRTLSRC